MNIKEYFKKISRKVNDPETERYFRETCSLYESQCFASNQPFSQDYQEYINHYNRITSLYLIKYDKNRKTELFVYDTESEREELKLLDTPEKLRYCTCITQLPNGELFFYGNNPPSGITLIIDKSYGVRILPLGIPCFNSSAIYFNNNIYCFGGENIGALALSMKFDLNKNRWTSLSQISQAYYLCHTVIFNRNILISDYCNRNLLIYSIDTDSFSTVPYDFAENTGKILVNVERLYLIECWDGLIYEGEDEYNWKQISNSIISESPTQVYCSYNKGSIYISNSFNPRYYRFDLSSKKMMVLQ